MSYTDKPLGVSSQIVTTGAQAAGSISGAAGAVVAMLGHVNGGMDNIPLRLTSKGQTQRLLRGTANGDIAYQAALQFWEESQGQGTLIYVPIKGSGAAQAATASLNDRHGTPTATLKVYSAFQCAVTWKYKILNGTESNTFKFQLFESDGTTLIEEWDNLNMDPTDTQRYCENVVNGSSYNITMEDLDNAHSAPENLPALVSSATTFTTTAGSVGSAPATADYQGVEASQTGIYALLPYVKEILMVCVPGSVDTTVLGALKTFCQTYGLFMIVDSDRTDTTDADRITYKGNYDTINGEIWHPWITMTVDQATLYIPPSALAAGARVRTLLSRGSFAKALGNEILNTAVTGLEDDTDDTRCNTLHNAGINIIRNFTRRTPSRGYRFYGNRSMSSSSLWKYAHKALYMLWVQKTIDAYTEAFPFEPNNPTLWRSWERAVKAFLEVERKAGWLYNRLLPDTLPYSIDILNISDPEALPDDSVFAADVVLWISGSAEKIVLNFKQGI